MACVVHVCLVIPSWDDMSSQVLHMKHEGVAHLTREWGTFKKSIIYERTRLIYPQSKAME